MLKRLLTLLTDALVYGAAGFIGPIIGFVLLPIYTQFLNQEDYGILNMVTYVPLIFSVFASAGMKSAVFQQYHRQPDESERSVALGTGIFAVFANSAVLLTIGLLAAEPLARVLLGNKIGPHEVWLLRVSICSAAVGTMAELPTAILQSQRRIKTVATLDLLQITLTITTSILFVVYAGWGVLGVIAAGLIGHSVDTVLNLLLVDRSVARKFDWQLWRTMAAYALPFLPHRLLAAAMLFFSEYMVRVMLGLGPLGLYAVAVRFALPIGFVSAAIQQAWTPYKFKVFAEEADHAAFFRSIFTYYVAGLLYLWVGLSLWGPDLLRVMTAPQFHPAWSIIWAVCLMRVMQAVYPMMATGVELGSNTRTVPLTSAAGLVTALLTTIPLIERYGAVGAALGTALAWGAVGVAFYFVAQRQIYIRYDLRTVAALALVAAGVIFLGYEAQSLTLWTRLALFAGLSLAYPLVAFLILMRSETERHRMEIIRNKLSSMCAPPKLPPAKPELLAEVLFDPNMPLTDYVLYRIAKNWPSPVKYRAEKYGAEPETDAYDMAYTYDQFNRKVRDGLRMSCSDKDVLEIGCGHGGISCYLAVAGSRSVVGIDLNTKHLEFARRFASIVESRFGDGARLPLKFEIMSAYEMTFPENSFDIVVAENAFEHFMQPETVMQQSYKVLRPGGGLLVPIFSSIYSKYGLHLKLGLKMPWANLFFSEPTILRAMQRLAAEEPKLYEFYPGLANNPQHVRDVRPYKDLNDITFKKFKQMAHRTGFVVDWFYPNYTRFGTFVRVTPVLKHSILMDIFSQGAAALLRKPA